ncbi:MAG: outer membrane beta-barrel protein [Chitinophagaceae bacterium]|nr:outer membrane beta-barrel protein [Chitinophagaceae bacterium]
MKKVFLIMLGIFCAAGTFAQVDTTVKQPSDTTGRNTAEGDTIRVGNIIIIKKGGDGRSKEYNVYNENKEYRRRQYKRDNITTNWMIVDIGYSGFNDQTNYSSAAAQSFIKNAGSSPVNEGDFSIKGARISNFNLWFFMQRMNLIEHVVNLKYGFGIENNNYYYKTNISYVDGGNPYVIRDSVNFSKNKLAADYLTVPFMLNFNFNPNNRHGGIQLSVGASAGFLYSVRQKQKSGERGKQKQKTDFNLERWKFAYVAELGLGPVRFYGSYAITPLHKYGVEQLPYTVGIRFSSW